MPSERGDRDGGGPPEGEREAERQRLAKGAGFPLNDYGNGQRVVHYHGEDVMFVARIGWFAWDGHRWAQDFDGMAVRRRAHAIPGLIKREAFEIGLSPVDAQVLDAGEAAKGPLQKLKAKGAQVGEEEAAERARLVDLVAAADQVRKRQADKRGKHLRHAKSAGNSGPITNMLREAEPYVERKVTELNAEALAINTERVTLELVEREDPDAATWEEAPVRRYAVEERVQARGDLVTKMMPVVYDPDATCPRFLAFLEDIQPEAEMRAFLQRWFGYTLTGLTSEQKLVFFHGAGRNGKSTLVDLIAKMLGEYATTVPIESLTGNEQRKGADATPDLVRLPGARMVRASEPEEGIRFREATVKTFTGGEPILVRKMREEFVEVEPIFKLTISGNHKPNVRGTDEGIWRRILLVPFDQQIPRERIDPLLGRKLWEERSGVLNWLLAGAIDFLNFGLREPPGVVEATEQFRDDSDPVRTFLLDACKVTGDPEDFVLTRDLVEAFQTYQRDQGGQPWGNRAVSLRIAEKAGTFRVDGQTFARRKTAAANGYAGVRLGDEMNRRLADAREQVQGRRRPSGGGGDADDLV